MHLKSKLKVLVFFAQFFFVLHYVKGCSSPSPLGLSNGYIKNYQITASSYKQLGNLKYLPSQARLGIRSCWCGNFAGKGNWVDDWLQVSFDQPVTIKGIATQGDPNEVSSFVTKFYLEFSDDGKKFYYFNDTSGKRKEFDGNTNNFGVKFNWISESFSTRFVRFRATNLNNPYDGSVCLRMELYGCRAGKEKSQYGKSLFPLGIENGQLQDNAITASSAVAGRDAKLARLNNAAGWCASSNTDQWLQVDLGREFSVDGVAVQGFGEQESSETVKKFQVSYSITSDASSLRMVEDLPGRAMLFSSDAETSQDPFMAVFPNPVTARFVRIIPKTKGFNSTMYCMRIEIFGHNDRCYKSITEAPGNTFSSSSTKSGSSDTNAFLFSATTWCANTNDANQFIKIHFSVPKEVSGVAIQGDANNADWIKSFKVKYKPQCGTETELSTVFDGNSDSHGVTRHWFSSVVKAEYLTILPQSWNNNICLRLQVLGCRDDTQRVPLGMQSGFLSTSQMSASSVFSDDIKFGPGQARLGMNTRWCGKKTGTNFVDDYHEVDFGRMVILTGVATQGDPSYGPGDNYVKKFYLETANSSRLFTPIKQCSTKQIFSGNVDQTTIKYNYISYGVIARYVRFRATELARIDANKLVCLRLEYYGVELNGYTAAGGKGQYALGMEDGLRLIKDTQLSASGEFNGNPARNGRLNFMYGWCPGSANDGWLQITFPYSVTITAVALQGHGGDDSPDRTFKYHVQYRDSSTWKNVKDISSNDKLFIGNNVTSRDPVMDFLPLPLTVDKFRINPYILGVGSTVYCLRAEIYGYHAVCSDDLTNSVNTLITGSSHESIDYASTSRVNSPVTWCAKTSESNPHLLVNLGSPKTITGFGVQGDSNGDNWATEVKISHGNEQCCMTEMTQTFKGSVDRNRVIRNWFSTLVTAQFFKIKINTKNGKACMRIQVLGCDTGHGRTPLGMGNGFIKDSQITASSRYSDSSSSTDWDASTGRLGVTANRWCSAKPLNNYRDWLQVDFKRNVTITGIATQGDDNYHGNYVTKFYLQVSFDGNLFRNVPDQFGKRQDFTGNTDHTGIVYNWLPVPTKTRYVRLRASSVPGEHICARLEYYGTADDQAAGKSLYALGMESGVIADSQISSSGNASNNDVPKNARFRKPNIGWCAPNTDDNQWLQIDFKQRMVITAVATQGHGGGAAETTYKYYLMYGNSSSGSFEFVGNASANKMLFTGNNIYKNVPVMNLLTIPITTQYLRINPITKGDGSTLRCLRAEIYGYHPECSDDLTRLQDTRITASSTKTGKLAYRATIYSENAWCPSTSAVTEYIQVDLGNVHRITGIGIQGDSENDFWPKKFKISHGKNIKCLKEMTKEYTANTNRNGVTRHWFLEKIFARFIRIRVTSFNGAGSVCLRIQVLGCKDIIRENLDTGRTPLGMGNGFIKDSQITATSRFLGPNDKTWKGSTGRLRVTANRWCSAQPLNYQDWLQVDFKRNVTITGIATQGDDNHNLNYVKQFYLQVSFDGTMFANVTNKFCEVQDFTGNTNNNGIVYNWLSVPTKARYVKFRASSVSGTHICARLEYYGTADDQAAGKSLYALGMESGVIADSQISSFGNANSNDVPQNARFKKKLGVGWCAPNTDDNQWLQIDFKQRMVITAVATQGHGGGAAVETTYKYYLMYGNSSSGSFEFVGSASAHKMLFTGNNIYKNVPVMNLLPISITAQYLRINPITKGDGSTLRCLRTEIYGYHPVCYDDLTKGSIVTASTNLVTNQPRNAFVNSGNTWCAQSSNTTGYIDVILSSPRVVTAVGIQGDSNGDNWIKTFKVSHALDAANYKEVTKTFTGNTDRNSVVRHWLLPPVFAKYIRIKADTFNNKVCARTQVIGCSKDYAVISNLAVKVINMRRVDIIWTTIHSASSNFTVQYRKIGVASWTDINDVSNSKLRIAPLEKYKTYEVRLKTVKGLLVLQDAVTGGSEVSESQRFFFSAKPLVIPNSVSAQQNGAKKIDIQWKKVTQDQNLDWDIQGLSITVSCTVDHTTKSCNSFQPKEYNITNAELNRTTIPNLTSWTNYTIKVQVYNGLRRGEFSPAITVFTGEEAPSVAPNIVTASGKRRTIDLTAEVYPKDKSNGKLLGYHILYRCVQTDTTRDCTDFSWNNITHYDISKTNLAISGLMSWTLYEVTIQVFNSAGTSPISVAKNVTTEETEPSSAPSHVQAVVINSTCIEVSWSPLKKNETNGNITKYTLTISNADTSSNRVIEVFTNEHNVTGLKPFTNYSIQVAAVNNAGTGPHSEKVSRQTLEAPPNKAPSIQSTSATKFSAKIKIQNIEKDDENGVILGYKISYRCLDSNITRRCQSKSSTVIDFTGSGITEFSITNLMSWTAYGIKISVYNKAGSSPYSKEVMSTTLEEAPRISPKPITLKALSSRSLLFEWRSLEWNDTNGLIISYSIGIKSIKGQETLLNVSASDRSYAFTGLKPYTNYTVRIAAINKAGFGPYSDYIMQQTKEEAPSMAPTITRIETSRNSANIYIQNIDKAAANGKLLGYHISYRCISNKYTRDCPEPGKTTNITVLGYPETVISISNLFSWMKYAVTIQVYNSAGVSKQSNEIIASTKEDTPSTAPSDITIDITGSRSFSINWNALSKNDTNGNITGYSINIQFTRRGSLFNITRFTTELQLPLDNLFPYTEYTIKIAAKNSAGLGKYSVGKQNRTLQDAPSSPRLMQTTPRGTTTIYVQWSEPLDRNGIITKYELQYCLKNSNCTTLNLPANKTDKVVQDLETHVDYIFKVRAFTISPGNWSEAVTQKTEEGIPTMPVDPFISNRQKTSLKLTWKQPKKPRGVIRYYKIKVSGKKAYNSSFSHVFEIRQDCGVTTCNSHVIERLIPSTLYTLDVAVATSAGLGPYSVDVSAETLISEPPKPFFTAVSKLQDGGTERNLTINTVTNLYGPIIAYQVIVQKISTVSSKPMTSFPSLRSKTEAEEQGFSYYLATEKKTSETPFLIRLRPGIAYVEAFDADLDTPGQYYLHFRAVSQMYRRPKSNRLYGESSVYHLERSFLKKLPEPKQTDIGSNTIKIKITTTLPKGFVPTHYYIIAVELAKGTNPKDPSSYKQEDLKKYDAAAYQPGTPYIAAVLTSSEFSKITYFTLGDGTTSRALKSRRKRQSRAVAEEYLNSALKPEKSYSVFVRAVSASSAYYSTPWTAEVKTKAAPPSKKKTSSQGGAIGAGVSVSIIIVLIGAGFAVYFKRRRDHGKSSQSTEQLDEFEEQEMNVKKPRLLPKPQQEIATTDVDGVPYEPINLKINQNANFPSFAAKDIVQVVKRKSAMEDAGFNEEFQNLPQGQLFTWRVGGNPEIKPRNRFANIIAYDYSRVKLRNSQDGCDYINASYVVDYHGRQRYIASQAPVPKTICDFWTMIWEQEPPAIVMLTKCVEGNKRKSEEYWPTSGSQQHGDIQISYLGAEEYPEYIISTLEMQKGDSIRTCKHFHYMTWPDHGVPSYPTSLLSFRRRLRQAFPYDSQNNKPIIVHCSAGVGRTGAFIAVDTLIHLIHKQRIVDVFSYVNLLRLQRPEMVQRAIQYKFIYDCLLEAAVCGVTEISAQEFRQRFNNLSNKDQKTGKDGFHREFTCLSFVAIDIEEQEFSSAKQSCIAHKNRDPTVLPRNTQRVFLPALEFTEGCNYINAVFVDGQHQDQFIATQAPLESTIGDFWRMVIDRASSTVVSLVDHNEAFPRYYPENNQAKYDDGQLTVSLQSSEDIGNDITLRRFIATDNMFNRTSNEIHHYSLKFWPEHSVPESTLSLIKLINEVEKTQRSYGGGPIIVHCSNGAGRTGTFIAAYIILERLKSEQMLDVFQVVRRIRKTRPRFVENREQYKLLYEVVSNYLAQFSTYSNF